MSAADRGAFTLLVVRPRAQALEWVRELAAVGVAARALPLIEILPAPQPAQVMDVFVRVRRLASDANELQPLLVFVSPNAVAGFFSALRRAVAETDGNAVSWPPRAWAAATGPGTVAALRVAGVPAECVASPPDSAEQFDSEALWRCIRDWPWQSRSVWIVRGNGGRDLLAQEMRAAGAEVDTVQSYGRAAPRLSDDESATLAAALAEPDRWLWMFSSSEAIDHLENLAPGIDWRASRALASHPRIGERARRQGFGEVQVIAPTLAAVARACATVR